MSRVTTKTQNLTRIPKSKWQKETQRMVLEACQLRKDSTWMTEDRRIWHRKKKDADFYIWKSQVEINITTCHHITTLQCFTVWISSERPEETMQPRCTDGPVHTYVDVFNLLFCLLFQTKQHWCWSSSLGENKYIRGHFDSLPCKHFKEVCSHWPFTHIGKMFFCGVWQDRPPHILPPTDLEY